MIEKVAKIAQLMKRSFEPPLRETRAGSIMQITVWDQIRGLSTLREGVGGRDGGAMGGSGGGTPGRPWRLKGLINSEEG